jgi:hypothetical protein
MGLTNAQRQARYRQRLKDRLAFLEERVDALEKSTLTAAAAPESFPAETPPPPAGTAPGQGDVVVPLEAAQFQLDALSAYGKMWREMDSREVYLVMVNAKPPPVEDLMPAHGELFNADPNCEHNIVHASGGGVKCSKCPGWFCY